MPDFMPKVVSDLLEPRLGEQRAKEITDGWFKDRETAEWGLASTQNLRWLLVRSQKFKSDRDKTSRSAWFKRSLILFGKSLYLFELQVWSCTC